MSFCKVCKILSAKFYTNQTTHGRKMTLCRFSRWWISAILHFRGPIMGSLKSPCTTSYRSSIETIALNCLVFEKIAFLHLGDRQTDRQRNRWTAILRMADQQIVCSINWRHFQWLGVTPNSDFNVTPLFDAEYPRNATRYRHSYNEILTRTYTRPIQGCHFEWPYLSDLAKYSVTRSMARSLGDSLASCVICNASKSPECRTGTALDSRQCIT